MQIRVNAGLGQQSGREVEAKLPLFPIPTDIRRNTMSVKFTNLEVKKGDSFKFRPEDLKFSSFVGRRHGASPESIEKMITSLLLPGGQLQDVGVRKGPNGEPLVIFGHTRVLAARAINERKLTPETFLIRGTYFNVNEEEAAIMTIQENDGDTRTPISCIDLAYLVRELETKFGYTNQQIADKLGKQATQMCLYRRLLGLESKIQEHISHKNLSLETALSLVNVAPEERATVLEMAEESGRKVTASQIAKVAKEAGAATSQSFKRGVGELRKVLGEAKDSEDKQLARISLGILEYLNGQSEPDDLLAILGGT